MKVRCALRKVCALKANQRYISSDGILSIGETGVTTNQVGIIVEGKVTGNIIANDLVELRKTSELRGDITASNESRKVYSSSVSPMSTRQSQREASPGNSPKPVPAQPPKQEENK